MYRDSQPQFAERFDPLLRQGFARVTDWIGEHAYELAQRLHRGAPQTLIHGDLRLDNVFFDEEKPDDPVILIDWQLAGCGAGAYDVAYLLGGSLDAASGRDVEEDLLRTYHETLIEYGVKDYAYGEFRRDYERALLTVLQTIASTDTMDLGENRGASLIDLWVERLFVRTRELELDRLR